MKYFKTYDWWMSCDIEIIINISKYGRKATALVCNESKLDMFPPLKMDHHRHTKKACTDSPVATRMSSTYAPSAANISRRRAEWNPCTTKEYTLWWKDILYWCFFGTWFHKKNCCRENHCNETHKYLFGIHRWWSRKGAQKISQNRPIKMQKMCESLRKGFWITDGYFNVVRIENVCGFPKKLQDAGAKKVSGECSSCTWVIGVFRHGHQNGQPI